MAETVNAEWEFCEGCNFFDGESCMKPIAPNIQTDAQGAITECSGLAY